MADYCIMTDSCCDLDAALTEELELSLLPLTVYLGEESYRNYPDEREITFKDFYQRVRDGALGSTAAPSTGDFESAMEAVLSGGRDILCVCFSSALSATYQSACIAAEHMREKYPERTIEVVDSLCASGGQGLLVWLCVQEKRAGKSLAELLAYTEAVKHKVCSWFTVDDLFHLKRGGRVSAATALFGTMLNIKPVLHVDTAGRLINVGKARGRRASLLELVRHMEQTVENPAEQTIFITHGDCLEDAEFVADEIRRRMGVKDVRISYVGPVIGCHTGTGVVALFFLGAPR